MMLKCFVLILVTLLSVWAQQPGQQVALTREIVEDLLRVLSVNCRTELESAIESQSLDLSTECKYEIQKNLMDMGHVPSTPGMPDSAAGYEEMPQDGMSSRTAASKPAENGWISPVVGIIGFVVVLFAAAAYAVLQISPKIPFKESKKLSKKKEEKLRMKGQSR